MVARDGLPDKLGLADVVMLQTCRKVGIFFHGHVGLGYMVAVGQKKTLADFSSASVGVYSVFNDGLPDKRELFSK